VRNLPSIASIWAVLGSFLIGTLLAQQDQAEGARIYRQVSESVFFLLTKGSGGQDFGQGTGFLIEGGNIVTNEHVIRGSEKVFLLLGGAKIPLAIARVDATHDLAILTCQIELTASPLVMAENLPATGDSVYAIGNPQGLNRSISAGILSGVRNVESGQLLQITAALSPGSSGGPVFNSSGQVIGVAEFTLTNGQNLNFAVPVSDIRALLRSAVKADGGIIDRLSTLSETWQKMTYSAEPDSDYQKLNTTISELLSRAISEAGDDKTVLRRLSALAQAHDFNLAITVNEKLVSIDPSGEHYLMLCESLNTASWFDTEKKLLPRREEACRKMIKLSKQPTAHMQYLLGSALEDKQSWKEAEAAFQWAVTLTNNEPTSDDALAGLRGLIRVAYATNNIARGKWLFDELVKTGKASTWDYSYEAGQLASLRDYSGAAHNYLQAANLGKDWNDWCRAGNNFWMANDYDSALYTARKCVSEGAGQEKSEQSLSGAHSVISEILNERGVYEEALSHAREAVTLSPEDPWGYYYQGEALVSLRRFQEAINAVKQAIALSDGKYPDMHFLLGSAYFSAENWEFAKQSFQKAAEMEPTNDAAAYNVALCLVRLGYNSDGASWYEEVLKRNPERKDRDELLRRIAALRQ
jgi:tetratricopeptide (TPR) repeat protein